MSQDQENMPPLSSASSKSGEDDVTPETPENEQERCTLQQILNEKLLTDMTVVVGAKKKRFELHRAIISFHSEILRVVCTGPFAGTLEGEIQLPFVDVEVFDVIVNWMYAGGLQIDKLNLEAIDEVYRCAGYLQMPGLQEDMRKRVFAAVPWADPLKKEEEAGSLPLEIQELERTPFRGRTIDEKAKLKQFAERMADEGLFSRVTAKGYGTNTQAFAVFLAVRSRRLEKTLNRITCGSCQLMIERDQVADFEKCVMCAEETTRKHFLEDTKHRETALKAGYASGCVEMHGWVQNSELP
ncbi:hypothetical protein ABW21_db0201580 [Orbilia brochopaga]|nr:hypothetical protein ABW21_db0201580 [Drechslerella brochopaga]